MANIQRSITKSRAYTNNMNFNSRGLGGIDYELKKECSICRL